MFFNIDNLFNLITVLLKQTFVKDICIGKNLTKSYTGL